MKKEGKQTISQDSSDYNCCCRDHYKRCHLKRATHNEKILQQEQTMRTTAKIPNQFQIITELP